uniref:Uncharacterized protein n=1 Tax=Trichogramma kaykai TaxID=54128 RepID=A0ABD2VTF7_9HYME
MCERVHSTRTPRTSGPPHVRSGIHGRTFGQYSRAPHNPATLLSFAAALEIEMIDLTGDYEVIDLTGEDRRAEIDLVDGDNDVQFLAELPRRALQPNFGDNEVQFLAELPRQPPVRALQSNFEDDASDDDVIFMDAASCDMVSSESARISISAEELSDAVGSAADSGLGGSMVAADGDGYASPNEGARAAAPLEQQPPRANKLQVAAAPDPEVSRGVAVDRLPSARTSRRQRLAALCRAAAGADRDAGASDGVEGRPPSLN